ncbi:MAG TPA: S41 family peptidase [Vicinamibacterales bacterium]|nr:S41 family peptidase [Vicinamibacterales bacterium]
MTSRTRLWVLAVSTPVIVFALVGGYLGQAMAKDDTYQHLRVFDDVVSHVVNNYVEEVDLKQAMRGAMRGLADALDPDSAYLTPDMVKTLEGNTSAGPADVGLEITRQYYLRVVSARDGSPAAKAGLRTGDFIRAIDNRPTRDMSVYEGARLLRGAVGSKVALLVIRGNAADPHELSLVRERVAGTDLTSRMADASTGYIRMIEFNKESPAHIKQAVDALARTGATRFIVDLRGTARGDLDDGIATARVFVRSGTLAVRQTKTQKDVIPAQVSDGAITAPVELLIDQGTAAAAELFASALGGNARAELVGERTLGRAARQQLVKLPDGSGLWLSSVRYLTPKSEGIHERGLGPDVEVDQPDVEFGAAPPAKDATLDKALERLAEKKAA